MKNIIKTEHYRIAICQDTHKPVVQIYTGIGWLCLHNDTIKEDQKEVIRIKKQLKKGTI